MGYYFKTYCTLPEDAIFIRESVFMEEQGFAHEFDEKDAKAKHIVLYNEQGRPVATCRYFPGEEDACYIVGRIAVLKEFRGKRYGQLILREAQRQVKTAGAEEICLAAQVRAARFYKKMGFSAVGDEFQEEHCPHVWMRKKLKRHADTLSE